MNKLFSVLGLFSIVLAVEVYSLDLNKELKRQGPFCGNIPVASNINLTWVRSEEIWYFPFVTRSNLVLWTKVFASEEEFQKMSKDRAREKSCFGQTFKEDEEFEFFGLGNNLKDSLKLHYNPIRPGVIDVEHNGEYGGTSYFMKTDNKSFVVGITFFPDGSRGGYVMTPFADASTRFSEEQVLEWEKQFEEVGFEKESLVELPVDCARQFWETLKKKRSEDSIFQ